MTPIQLLIMLHAIFGGLALCGGLVAASVKKGSQTHKLSGRIFFYSMLFSAILSVLIANLPNHQNPFLMSIGIFTLYLIISGFRAIRKNSQFGITDKLIAVCMAITGLCMILIPFVFNGRINLILIIFGCIGTGLALQDLRMFTKPKGDINTKKVHLGKMSGGLIASITAFLVVNNWLPFYMGWFLPTILGTFYIVFHLRKVDVSGN
jgi:uncharacterized membrane protein